MTAALPPELVVPVRPLSFRELLDIPFAVVAAALGSIAAICGVAVLAGEAFIVAIVLAADLVAGRMSNDATQWVVVISSVIAGWWVCTVLRSFATAVGLAYSRGEPITMRGALRQVRHRTAPLLTATAVAFGQGSGVLVLALPVFTIPLLLWWLARIRAQSFLILPLIVAEQLPFASARRRSKDLMRGAAGRFGWAWLALRALLLLFVPLLVVAATIISDFSGTGRWAAVMLLSAVVLGLAALTGTLDGVMRVLGYVDRRCRREAADIKLPA